MKKEQKKQPILEKIFDYSLEEIMGERFGRYSKYIIQDRAIPDVRDGLKPVQRRILYGMYKEKHTYDRPYVKSARSVGDIMGKYHPHGDSSIYDAMVRMSQWWKQNEVYIDMHGNNGSMDGDSPAAMRYTEARLSKISNELLKDIDKDTVVWAPNFDDSLMEPTVLPAKYPNLLVNGSTGISAGYATNIPPHNLGEVIDATIKRIDSPNCTLESVMQFVKGPDFPTGGIVEGKSGILQAYTKGRGKVIIKSRTHFEEEKKALTLVVTELPFEVNKAQLVRKIDEIRIDKKIDGILEVRDETDRSGLRIAIDLKKDANQELILNYLLKNTDLQISYNFNMIAIVNRRPKLLGLLEMLDAYIAHQKEVVTKRTQFDLAHAKARLHIVEGLIKCISILDQVVMTIRRSANKQDAKANLMAQYQFTELQAEAIVMLQLYKLTNTDVTLLEEELKNLNKIVTGLELILSDESALKNVMKEELRRVKKEYAVARRTDIKEEITEIKIDTTSMIPKEDVIVMITKDGYLKRTSIRSYQATSDEVVLKDDDYIIGLYQLNTQDTLLLFTNFGNYLYVPVHTIWDLKWKEMGKHISNLVKIEEGEEIVSCVPVADFTADQEIMLISKMGMIKQTKVTDFKLSRYSKPIVCMKLKEQDRLVSAFVAHFPECFIATKKGYGLWFDRSEIPIVGLKASGVKGIQLKEDEVVSLSNFDLENCEYVTVVTDKGTGKRVKMTEFEKSSRARRGLLLLREVKTNPYRVVRAFATDSKTHIGLKGPEITLHKVTELPIADRYSVGSAISKQQIDDVFEVQSLQKIEEMVKQDHSSHQEKKEPISLKEIDDPLMTIDDFLNGQ